MGIGHGEGLRGAFGGGGGGWGAAAKACDSCKSAAAALFCRADSAFLCLGCDAKIHCANKLASRHERVWMCEVCEHAPAAVTCKADAAALCVSCDADIHSANPLARRHDRVPVEPFFDPADSLVRSSASAAAAAASLAFFSGGACDDDAPDDGACRRHDDVDPSPWIITSANFAPKLVDPPAVADVKAAGAELFYSEMDSFLDFDYSNPIHPSSGTDSVVPVKIKPISPSPVINNPDNCFDIEFCRSKLSSFAYPTQCLSHSVSSSSLDVGVVPDGSSASELSYAFGRSVSRAGSDPMQSGPASSSAPATQLCGLDREARVLRYREKRKNRKFEKTIRYASRKAYAETRPRIKGRFAKRAEIELENDNENDVVDHIYGSAFLADTQYGVVPTF